ncbi:H-NS histone family protein [Roseinatronobacter alkalisoli]|uniref:H-NS histone family protein n=1 Tax=Roseinatronobacter alkalisoli TaxID=3028235 RepID=A0ABT5T9P2_9RHOB|nr:H-NS histone family protein [Roseinatronobacter sp. HJB301]MDD7971101.1 H-NS histone family protein [Roseinatronobacter sp. HJB301]
MLDLNTLSLAELKKLQKDVAKAIDNFHDRERKAALAELEAVAKERGFTLAQLLDEGVVKTRKPVEPKYANPANPSETWTGRGRKPRWVVAALGAGKSLDDLAI